MRNVSLGLRELRRAGQVAVRKLRAHEIGAITSEYVTRSGSTPNLVPVLRIYESAVPINLYVGTIRVVGERKVMIWRIKVQEGDAELSTMKAADCGPAPDV